MAFYTHSKCINHIVKSHSLVDESSPSGHYLADSRRYLLMDLMMESLSSAFILLSIILSGNPWVLIFPTRRHCNSSM